MAKKKEIIAEVTLKLQNYKLRVISDHFDQSDLYQMLQQFSRSYPRKVGIIFRILFFQMLQRGAEEKSASSFFSRHTINISSLKTLRNLFSGYRNGALAGMDYKRTNVIYFSYFSCNKGSKYYPSLNIRIINYFFHC